MLGAVRIILGFAYYLTCLVFFTMGREDVAVKISCLLISACILVALAYQHRQRLNFPATRLRFFGLTLAVPGLVWFGTIGFDPGAMALAGVLWMSGLLIYGVGEIWERFTSRS